MPQFDVTTFTSQIFWLIVCFFFLCTVMARYLVPRLTSVLEGREQRLQEDRDQAKTLSAKEESLKKENLARLADARGKAHAIIHKAMQEAHRSKSARIAGLDEELIISTKNIRNRLEGQTQKILGNMVPLVSQVVKITAPRILGRPLPLSQINAVVQDVLKKRETL